MANWLVTVDYDDFELDKAFDALPQIYWKNSTTNQDKGLCLSKAIGRRNSDRNIIVYLAKLFMD